MVNVIKVDDFKALTDKIDAIATAIQNLPPSGGELVFDNTEKKVGKWFGKDLYSKTFDLRNAPLTYQVWNEDVLGTKNSGIIIVSFDGFLYSTQDGAYVPLNYYRMSSNYVFSENNATNDDMSIYNHSTLQNNLNVGFITIWYIKESW